MSEAQGMSFPEAIKTCMRRSFSFSGRAGRAEFWWLALLVAGIHYTAVTFLWQAASDAGGPESFMDPDASPMAAFEILDRTLSFASRWSWTATAAVAPFLPALWSASARRLQDIGLPGVLSVLIWTPVWAFLGVEAWDGWNGRILMPREFMEFGPMDAAMWGAALVLALGAIPLALKGKEGRNRYGPDPRGTDVSDAFL